MLLGIDSWATTTFSLPLMSLVSLPYSTVTFENAFVVRNIKVIQGSNGLFIAMPSRKMKYACSKCNFKNDIGSKFCNQCGATIHSANRDSNAPDAKAEARPSMCGTWEMTAAMPFACVVLLFFTGFGFGIS